MSGQNHLDAQVQRLRQEFDDSFTYIRSASEERNDRFVRVTCAGNKYAIALQDISLLQGDAKIVAVPTSNPRLLGIGSVRGEIIAVFDLASCLSRSERGRPASWLVRVIGTTAAFAFEQCDGLALGVVQETVGNERMVQCDGALLPLLPLKDLLRVARAKVEDVTYGKESHSV